MTAPNGEESNSHVEPTLDSVEDEELEEHEEEQQSETEEDVAQEYKTWKENCPMMYSHLSESVLDWQSLTIEFLPRGSVLPAKPLDSAPDVIEMDLLLGTYTSDNKQNHLMLGSAQFSDKQKVKSTLTIERRLKHEGEVNKARVMPQNNSIIATASNHGTVYLYNTKSDSDTYYEKLVQHKENGYGLSWNTGHEGYLLTSSDDRTSALWDTNGSQSPVAVYSDATDIVNDVCWQNSKNPHIFGAVSEDKSFYLYDTRTDAVQGASVKKQLHEKPINALAFSYASDYMFATGSSDKSVALCDLRNLNIKLHTFLGHSDIVTSLKWSPHHEQVLASGSSDRRVILWDMSKIGEEQSQEENEDGAPELLFMHGGHTSGVSDFSFNENYPWTMASVSEDNICQIWQPKLEVVGRTLNHVKNTDLE